MFCSTCGGGLVNGVCQKCNVGNNVQPGGTGLAVASMVLGIISLVICAYWYISLPCSIIGLSLGAVARKKPGRPGNGMAVAGIVTSIIALVLSALVLIGVSAFWTTLITL